MESQDPFEDMTSDGSNVESGSDIADDLATGQPGPSIDPIDRAQLINEEDTDWLQVFFPDDDDDDEEVVFYAGWTTDRNQFFQRTDRTYEGILVSRTTRTLKAVLFSGVFKAPARAAVQNFISFNGYYGCGTCLVKGTLTKTQKGHTTTFPFNDRK